MFPEDAAGDPMAANTSSQTVDSPNLASVDTSAEKSEKSSPLRAGAGEKVATPTKHVDFFNTDDLLGDEDQDGFKQRMPKEEPGVGMGRRMQKLMDKELAGELEAAFAEFDGPGLFKEPARSHAISRDDDDPAMQKKSLRVLAVRGGDIYLDLGAKSEGVVPALQFGNQVPKPGDLVEVVLDRYDAGNSMYLFRRPGEAQEADWGTIQKGMVVDAQIKKVNKGGLEVTVNGLRGFMPAGQVDLEHIADLSIFIGQTFRSMVQEVNLSARNLIVSRRAILEKERAERATTTLATLAEGKIYSGVVRRIMDFGAFVDIGGVDGLLHVKDMSWEKIRHPSEVVTTGQEVRVSVLSFDPDTKKIGLGLKQLMESPWSQAAIKYPIGTLTNGRVTKLMQFGAFVQLEPAIEGMIHISELAHKRVTRVGDVVKEGQEVYVKVLECDAVRQRIALSLKQAIPVEEPEEVSSKAEAQPQGVPEKPKPPKKPGAPLKGGLGGNSGPLFG